MANTGAGSSTKETQSPCGTNKMIDHSILFPPMPTSHSGIHQILRCLSVGTPQIRQMLLQETDVILECKVCRNLFRSVINFVDHKKKYCSRGSGSDVASSQSANFDLQELYSRESEEAVYVEPQSVEDSVTGGCGSKSRSKAMNRQQNSFIILRKIPSTSQALEQQILTPDQIISRADIDEMSMFGHQKEYTASKLIGEITMKQVMHPRKSSVLEKRESLHEVIKKQISPLQSEPREESSQEKAPQEVVHPPVKSPVQKPVKSPEGPADAHSMKVVGPKKSPGSTKEPKVTTKPSDLCVAGQENVCKICRKKCKNWTALAWHMRIHKRPCFKCSVCTFQAATVFNLRRHLQQAHHFNKDWVDKMLNPTQRQGKNSRPPPSEMSEGNIPTCNVCLKTFANRRNVLRHMEIHKRPEKGPLKGKPKEPTQTSKEDWARLKVMQIMDEKKLMCRKCDKKLSSMRRLHQHVCNHFSLNRYRCKSCPYENSDYTQMRRHIMGKHGRQFRTIQQISGAIKSMKVGIWINFAQFEGAESADTPAKKVSQKDAKDMKLDLDENKERSKDDKSGDTEEEETSGAKESSEDEEPEAPETRVDASDSMSDSDITNIREETPKVGKTACEDVPTSSTPQSSPQVTPKKNSSDSATSPRDSSKRPLRPNPSPKNLTTVTTPGRGQAETDWGEQDKVLLEAIMDKKNIRCITCNRQYQYLSSLQRHVRLHLLPSDNQSTQVKSNPDAAPRKAKAIQALINVNQMKCLKCRKRFTTMSSLKRHVGRHLGYSTFKCRFCGYISRNYTWFKQHLLSKHPSELVNKLEELGTMISSMKTKR